MWRRDWLLFVADMQEAIQKIGCYVELMSFADFQAVSRMVNAVVHNLLVIGEAARCLPTSIKERHPGIDWSAINGLRHRIAREDFGTAIAPSTPREPHPHDPGFPRDRAVQPQHRAGHRFNRCQSG